MNVQKRKQSTLFLLDAELSLANSAWAMFRRFLALDPLKKIGESNTNEQFFVIPEQENRLNISTPCQDRSEIDVWVMKNNQQLLWV